MVDPLELVLIPSGEITLSDARTASTRVVSLEPFEIARVPVTVEAFGGMPGSMPRVPAHDLTWWQAIEWLADRSRAAGLEPAYFVEDGIARWNTGADGYRLPTEAEWEFACRAGTALPTYGPLEEIAWTALDDITGPQPVGAKRPNDFGLFDTLGNVWEWCWDYADTARYGDYRVLRGGGWADRKWSVRASVRRGSAPDARLDDIGFRVARGAVGEPGALDAQGWSVAADRERADIRGPLPVGWTPLRQLLTLSP